MLKKIVFWLLKPIEWIGATVYSIVDWVTVIFTALTIYMIYKIVDIGVVSFLPILIAIMFVVVNVLLWYVLVKKFMKGEFWLIRW